MIENDKYESTLPLMVTLKTRYFYQWNVKVW